MGMSSSTSPEFGTSTSSRQSALSPLAGCSRDTCVVEDDDVFGASCSKRTVFLNFSGCSSFAVSGPLFPMWMSLIMFSSCCLSASPDATACRSAISSTFLGSTGTSSEPLATRALFLSFTRSVLATLSLSMHSSLPYPSRFSRQSF